MYRLPLVLSVITSLVARATPASACWRGKRDSPVLPGYNADPHAVVFGDTYYIYPTADGQEWEGKSFYVWRSRDLVGWARSADPILTLNGASGPGNVPWADGKAWAPAVIERGGRYYLYHSGSNPAEGRITIGAAVADSPEGPFTGQPEAMIRNTERLTAPGDAIDPMAFHDPRTGRYLLYWGNGRALRAELNDDMVSVDWDTLGENAGLEDYLEAPFVVFRRGTYHMTWSVNDTRTEDYHVGYATAAAAEGPWTSHGVILRKDPARGILGTGHQSVFNAPAGTDDWYIAYHRFAIPGGDGYHRETTIDRLTFDPDTGLIQPVTPTLGGVEPRPMSG